MTTKIDSISSRDRGTRDDVSSPEQATVATQQTLTASAADCGLGRPTTSGSVAFPRKHGKRAGNNFVGLLQPHAGLAGIFGGDCDAFFITTLPQENMYGHLLYAAFGILGVKSAEFNGLVRPAGYGGVASQDPVLEFNAYGNSGIGVTCNVTLPRSLRRMMAILSKRGTTTTARYIDLDDPTVIINGTPVTEANFTGVSTLRNAAMTIGGWGYDTTGPVALGSSWNDGHHNYWPGDIQLMAITDNGAAISDANLRAIAAGADPAELLGGGIWKYYRDWSDGVTEASLAKPPVITSDTTAPATIVRGTGPADIEPGPTIRRQTQTKYLISDYVEFGYVWTTPDARGRRNAPVRLKGKVSGLSATGPNALRVTFYRRDGSIYWTKVVDRLAAAATTFDVSFDAPFTDRHAYLDIDIDGDPMLRCSVSKRCGVGFSGMIAAQSQGNQFFQQVDQARRALEDSAVAYVGQRGENDVTQAFEGTFQRHVVGETYNADGLAGFAKRWAEVTDAPIVLIEEAVGGTSVCSLLLDGSANVPDLRNPGNYITFTAADGAALAFNPFGRPWARMVQRIDYACGKVVTAVAHDWISADNAGTYYTDMIARPMYFGEGPGMIPEYKHYIYDGATFANTPSMVLVPANRHLQNPLLSNGQPNPAAAGPFASGHVVLPSYGLGRDTQYNWWRSLGATVAPQRHSLRNEKTTTFGGLEGGPHMSHAIEPGNFLNGQIIAEGLARAFGLSDSEDPYVAQLEWEDASHKALLVRVKLPNGGRLRTQRNLVDGAGKVIVRGFDVNWAGTTSISDWSWAEDDAAKGLVARLIPGTVRNSRDCVRITRPDGSAIPDTFKLAYAYGAPLDTGYDGDGFDWVLDMLHDGANFADGLGYSVMGSSAGSTLKEWTIADIVPSV